MSARFVSAWCVVCRAEFRYRRPGQKGKASSGPPPPEVCGLLACRARHTWTAEDWAGRARMAAARQAAGVALDALDVEALNRPASTVPTSEPARWAA